MSLQECDNFALLLVFAIFLLKIIKFLFVSSKKMLSLFLTNQLHNEFSLGSQSI